MTGLKTWVVSAFAMVVGFSGSPDHAALHYSLTFTGTSAGGTIAGTWGGTAAQGAYSDAHWGIDSGGRRVAGGAYQCNTGCTFNGTVSYLGASTTISLTATTLGEVERTETVSGTLTINLPRP